MWYHRQLHAYGYLLTDYSIKCIINAAKFFRCLYIVSSAFSSCFIGTKERPVERWGHAARQPLSVQQRYYQRHTYPSLLSTLACEIDKEDTFSYNICPFQVTSEFLCGSNIYQHVSVQVLTIHQQAKEDQIHSYKAIKLPLKATWLQLFVQFVHQISATFKSRLVGNFTRGLTFQIKYNVSYRSGPIPFKCTIMYF